MGQSWSHSPPQTSTRFGTPFATDWIYKNINGYLYTAAIPAEAGVVVLSDGNVNAGDDPIEAARVLGERRIPVITVAMQSGEPGEIREYGLDAPPYSD